MGGYMVLTQICGLSVLIWPVETYDIPYGSELDFDRIIVDYLVKLLTYAVVMRPCLALLLLEAVRNLN
jgi:hypothetical protein